MKEDFNDYLNINLPGKKNVIFIFPKQTFSPLDYEEKKENVALYKNDTLKKQFTDYILSNPSVEKYRRASFYLIRRDIITKLDEEKTISQLGIRNGDKIIISFYKPNMEHEQDQEQGQKQVQEQSQQGEICNSERKLTKEIPPISPIVTPVTKPPRKKKWSLYLKIGSVVLLIIIIIIIVLCTLPPRPPYPIIFTKEKLKVNKEYPVNRLFIFNSQQVNELKFEGEKIGKENSYHNLNETSDFIFITRKTYVEKDQDKLIEKEWYTGYIAIYHLMKPNITHNNHILYSQNFTDFLNITKKELNERDIYIETNESNYCFIKMDFYQNGNIKNIYLPKNFNLSYYSYIEEIIRLIIPKISDNLFIDSIDEALKELIEMNNNEENNTYNNTFGEEEENSEKDLRNLKFKRKKKYLNSKYSKKRLSNDDDNNNSEISYTTEDYILPPLSETAEYEFRQADIINNSIYDDTTNTSLDNNYTNLTELSIKSIETDEVRME